MRCQLCSVAKQSKQLKQAGHLLCLRAHRGSQPGGALLAQQLGDILHASMFGRQGRHRAAQLFLREGDGREKSILLVIIRSSHACSLVASDKQSSMKSPVSSHLSASIWRFADLVP